MVRISTLPHYGPAPEVRPIGTAPVDAVVHITTLPHRIDFAERVDRFIGIPYDARHMDCADLALLVQRELFGRDVVIAGKRPRPMRDDAQAQAIRAYTAQLADAVINPADGDAVLMREIGTSQAGHIGTYFFLNFTPYVLHTTALLGASVLHRMQDLSGTGLTLEGFYRWK